MEVNRENQRNEPREVENAAEPTPLLEYVCHPARRNRTVTTLTTLVLIVCVILVYLISYSPFMTFLAIVILFAALSGFYFPTRYALYDDHFIAKTKTQALRKDWKQFRSYYPDKNGVLLSPFPRPSRLENFRGYYLKFSGNRDEVMRLVEARIDFKKEA